MKKNKAILTMGLVSSLCISSLGSVPFTVKVKAAEQEVPKADYEWNFESDMGDALKGTAAIEKVQISIGDKNYTDTNNHVLNLKGGAKGSSYMQLPSDLYEGVNAETGFTYSFWLRTAKDIASYARVISSAANGTNEFAYAPYASDKVWNLLFDNANLYRSVYGTEPQKDVWNYITFTVDAEETTYYINGERVGSQITEGSSDELVERLNSMSTLTQNSLGKTNSTWSDPDAHVQLDDVRFYKKALTEQQVVKLAKEEYGFDAKIVQNVILGNAMQYTDGTDLEVVNNTELVSPDGNTKTQILKDNQGRIFYSVQQNGVIMLQASQLGIVTGTTDFSSGVSVENTEISDIKTEEYNLLSGKQSKVTDAYREMILTLKKDSAVCKVIIRNYNDGMAYRYEVIGEKGVTERVKSESSEFVLPYENTKLWLGSTSNTYEVNYAKTTSKALTSGGGNYTIPALASVDNGKGFVLLTEANVFNEEEPYCSSYLKNIIGERNLKVQFGNKVSTVHMKYDENGTFHTPWRVAIVAQDLSKLTDSNIVTSLNPGADEETYKYSEWVKSAKADWSWWSEAGDDPIEYGPQEDYIDFAAENGWDMVCLDFGWCLWKDYKTKVKHLCDYAAKKNVKVMLWYGVNNACHSRWFDADGNAAFPTYSLRTTDELNEQFSWAHSVGVAAVKVDYYESDDQTTMKQMEQCAKIAAKNKLCVLFHGCTMPGGENRTYPNILSYEAVFGEEYHKFGLAAPNIKTLLTYPYSRNIVGSMDYTPAALPVVPIPATAGFQLAQTVVYESGTVNLASSIYAYEGKTVLDFLNHLDSSWEESRLVDTKQAEPGEYVAIARRSRNKNQWTLGAMTAKVRKTNISLDFLGDGEYEALLFEDNASGKEVTAKKLTVNKDTIIEQELKANGGLTMLIAKSGLELTVPEYDYFEMEDSKLEGGAILGENPFASGLQQVSLGEGKKNSAVIRVKAAETGVYEMNVYYKATSDRQFAYSINGGNIIETPVICSGTNSIARYGCKIALNQGENEIRFCNLNDDYIGLDRVAVGKKRLIGEKATAAYVKQTHKVSLKKGKTFTKNGLKYKVVKVTAKGGEVICTGAAKKKASVTIPAQVSYQQHNLKVTQIAPKAFLRNSKIKKVIVGKNVTVIGKQAFYGCKNLNSVVIQSKKIKKVGSKAFEKISPNAKIKAPKGAKIK